MQRSFTHNQPLRAFLYLLFFVFYSSLSSIYPLLPPLFGLLLLLFARATSRRGNALFVFFVSLSLLVFEANFGYLLFSTLIYFYLVEKFVLPKIEQNFSCEACIKFSYVFLAYIGYFLFMTLFANIFLLEMPLLTYYVIYYILIEFLILSFL
jgi:hypothetical protein